MFTKCHSGYTCTYNAKEKLGYTESILNHRIDSIIKNIIPHWENDFPECIQDITCSDCESRDYNKIIFFIIQNIILLNYNI